MDLGKEKTVLPNICVSVRGEQEFTRTRMRQGSVTCATLISSWMTEKKDERLGMKFLCKAKTVNMGYG